ncbi:TetR/AcrR family transcriptional regulator [Kocuria sp.]|uniref:TetR/AcrR family transcriptional regulator n=1 Tax=Kocuria sp. TaxID=1871328 RepID=UPI0025C68BEE|nr:TetR/AcrR family transcriptional regulator [Kocuria sp.]
MGRDKPRRIIDTYVNLLVDSGVRQATIEAVARRCGLSKAGLLHHYPSRAALDAALLERLRSLVEEDVTVMREAPGGAVRYYLASSLDAESDLERIVVAATRLAQADHSPAGELLRWARDLWYDVLVEQLGDPLLARFVLLAGDGVSYHTDISTPNEQPFITADDIDSFTRVFETLQRSEGDGRQTLA